MADERLQQLPNVEDQHRLMVVDVEVAPYVPGNLAAYDADANYERLGTVEPGTVKPEITREFFKLERGLPKSLIKKFTIGQAGTVAFDLGEYSARAIEVANGGSAMSRTTTDATTVKTATTPTTTQMELTLATNYAVGKWVAITLSDGRTFDRKILAVASGKITVDPLPVAPAVGNAIAIITNWSQAGGGTEVTEYTMRIVATDTKGDKAYLYFPRVSSTGKLAPDWRADQNAIIPMEFDVHAVQLTHNGKTDLYPYLHYIVPA